MRNNILFLLLVSMMSLTGCDFFRVVAGRPTSKDIKLKKMELINEETARQARLDSIANEARKAEQDSIKAVQDSLDACAFIAENKVTVYTVARLGGIQHDGLEDLTSGTRYRVVLGSFRERANAENLVATIASAGDFWPHLISLKNGMIAVAACPSDRIQNVVMGFKELKAHSECPADAWILKVE